LNFKKEVVNMKKLIPVLVLLALISGIAHAQTIPEDNEYKDMEQLRKRIVRMKKEMNKLMEEVVSKPSKEWGDLRWSSEGSFRVDVAENDKEIVVKADLPGMEKDKIDITLENDRILKIAGTRETVKDQTAPGAVKQERSFGKFERILELPSDGIGDGIKASYKDGVLEVIIPKKKPSKEGTVKVKVL